MKIRIQSPAANPLQGNTLRIPPGFVQALLNVATNARERVCLNRALVSANDAQAEKQVLKELPDRVSSK
jgi:hypothetical protein